MIEVGGLTEAGAINELAIAIGTINDMTSFLAKNNIEVSLSLTSLHEIGIVDRDILSAVVKKITREV